MTEEEPKHALISIGKAASMLGVTEQTVRNYITLGVLKVTRIADKRNYVDQYAVQSLLSDFEDVKVMKENILKMEKEIEVKRKDIKDELEKANDDLSLASFLKTVPCHRQIIHSIVNSIGSIFITDRDKNIVFSAIDGESIKSIARRYGICDERVRSIIKNVFKSIELMPTYSSLNEKIFQLNDHIQTLEEEIAKKDEQIAQYKEKERQEIMKKDSHLSEDEFQKAKCLMTSLSDVGISARIYKGLAKVGVRTVGDIVLRRREKLLNIPYLGFKSISEIDKLINMMGLDYDMDSKYVTDLLTRYSNYKTSQTRYIAS